VNKGKTEGRGVIVSGPCIILRHASPNVGVVETTVGVPG